GNRRSSYGLPGTPRNASRGCDPGRRGLRPREQRTCVGTATLASDGAAGLPCSQRNPGGPGTPRRRRIARRERRARRTRRPARPASFRREEVATCISTWSRLSHWARTGRGPSVPGRAGKRPELIGAYPEHEGEGERTARKGWEDV